MNEPKDPITPSVIALHGALTELMLRISRVEQHLQMPDAPLATFARPGSAIPAPDDDYTPCSCEEAIALRARLAELESKMQLLEPIGWGR